MKISRTREFEKDLKRLLKRFLTLESDLKTFFEVQLKLFHEHSIDNGGIEQISDLGFSYPQFYKVTKFACKSLRGKGVRSGIRLIYSYYPDLLKIELIELYYKGDQENESRERINNLALVNIF